MQKEEIKETSLIGAWKKVMHGFDGTQHISAGDYDRYEFREDHRLEYTYVKENVWRQDTVIRRWAIQAPKQPESAYIITVNSVPHFKIISINDKEMVVELLGIGAGLIYHLERTH